MYKSYYRIQLFLFGIQSLLIIGDTALQQPLLAPVRFEALVGGFALCGQFCLPRFLQLQVLLNGLQLPSRFLEKALFDNLIELFNSKS